MTPHQQLMQKKISDLSLFIENLKKAPSLKEKVLILDKQLNVKEFLKKSSFFKDFLKNCSEQEEYIIKAIAAIDQASIVFNMHEAKEDKDLRLKQLLNKLIEIDRFYEQLGGIIGYHFTVLNLILNQERIDLSAENEIRYIPPEGLHINKETAEVRQCIRWGIENLKKIAVFYPIGGAGDRLNLMDETTGKHLPAAVLPFLGRTLLEGMIRDMQAFEYLYFKLYHEQLHTPIAMMTSEEKDNHNQIYHIVADHNWFGKSPDDFYFFMQPSVPVITVDGNWSMSSSLTLTLKPGGHGIIWKLAEEQGIFKKLAERHYHRAIVRQINNPLAGTDGALLALIGIGCEKKKSFGFLSCERLLHCAEGTNVLTEIKTDHCFAYKITNIEYTDFDQRGIGEVPLNEGSPYSMYPTNTNILFIHIPTIQNALKKCSIPGKLINMKTTVHFIGADGKASDVKGGRLESTMQNIADYLDNTFPYQLSKEDYRDHLQTFIIFNDREKTISTTKKSYHAGESPLSTPEQAHYDYLSNNLKLFDQKCRYKIPASISLEEYIENGPNCLIIFHPALGPLYSIIAQKIQKGKLAPNTELQLEIAEADIRDLDLDGSLLIESDSPLGVINDKGILKYGNGSRCALHHVTIKNKGIDRKKTKHYWKNQIVRHEQMKVVLHAGSEFCAENVTIEGNAIFDVPAYHRMVISQDAKGRIKEDLKRISAPTWQWEYAFDKENHIKLTMQKS